MVKPSIHATIASHVVRQGAASLGRRRTIALALMVVGVGVGTVSGSGQSLEEITVDVRADLQSALQELASVRQGIEAERVPLAQKVNALEDEVLAKRQEYDRAQRDADNALVSLGELRKEVERSRTEAKFLQALLTEYATRFETRIHISELARYGAAVQESKSAPGLGDLSAAARLSRQMGLWDVSVERVERSIGGDQFDGKALTPAGKLESGRYALLGPIAFFASSDGESSGIAELRLGSPQPRSIGVGKRHEPEIRALVGTGAGSAPIDPTLGNALKIVEKRDSVVAHIMKGGPVMVPILLMGAVAAVIALVKWMQLSQVRTATPMDLQKILGYLRKGERDQAVSMATRVRGPVGELLSIAVEHAREQKEYLEEVLYEKMLEVRPRLERLLPIIALTAACAPLLGLLGTVTGMINTFNMITIFGAGDPRTLSGGISEALITTEFGLVVAIPALLMHAFISRKVKGVLGSMEQTSVAFINGVPEPQNQTEGRA
jgi:biopolymer transport protein ExbB